MSLGRVLVEKFAPEVLEWLGARAEIVVVDPWAEPERWDREAPAVDAVISRKGRITRSHIEKSRGRLKIVARTGVGFDASRIDVDAAKEHKVWVTNMPGSNAVAVAELTLGQIIALAFEMSLVVCDPYIPESRVTEAGARAAALEALLAESDFVTLHCPHNRET